MRRDDGSKGGRSAFDHVLMFKILLLQAMHGQSDARAEYLIKDRLSFLRFLGLGLADAAQALFARFDATLKAAGSRTIILRIAAPPAPHTPRPQPHLLHALEPPPPKGRKGAESAVVGVAP